MILYCDGLTRGELLLCLKRLHPTAGDVLVRTSQASRGEATTLVAGSHDHRREEGSQGRTALVRTIFSTTTTTTTTKSGYVGERRGCYMYFGKGGEEKANCSASLEDYS